MSKWYTLRLTPNNPNVVSHRLDGDNGALLDIVVDNGVVKSIFVLGSKNVPPRYGDVTLSIAGSRGIVSSGHTSLHPFTKDVTIHVRDSISVVELLKEQKGVVVSGLYDEKWHVFANFYYEEFTELELEPIIDHTKPSHRNSGTPNTAPAPDSNRKSPDTTPRYWQTTVVSILKDFPTFKLCLLGFLIIIGMAIWKIEHWKFW